MTAWVAQTEENDPIAPCGRPFRDEIQVGVESCTGCIIGWGLMAYLNLKDQSWVFELDPVVKRGTYGQDIHQVVMRGSSAAWQVCAASMKEAFVDGANELRVEFAGGWTFFCKPAVAGGSRLLLAHPEKEQWVVSLLIDPAIAEPWMTAIGSTAAPSARSALRAHSAPLHPVSNFEFTLQLS